MFSTHAKPVVNIALAQSTFAFPPTQWAYVDALWNRGDSVGRDIEVEFWADTASNLTASLLYVGKLQTVTIASQNITTVTPATDTITKTAHGLLTGDGGIQVASTGAIPGGLAALTNYWVIAVDANNFKLASSLDNAMAPTPVPIDITSAGSGTISVAGTATSQRVHWHQRGLLGPASDGAIALTAQKAYTQRAVHDYRVIAYAVAATASAACSILVSSLMERP